MDIKRAIIKKHYRLAAHYFKAAGSSWSNFPREIFVGRQPYFEDFVWDVFKLNDEDEMFIHIGELYEAGISGDFSYLDTLSHRSLRRIFIESVRCLMNYYFKVANLFELLERAKRGSYILEDLITFDF